MYFNEKKTSVAVLTSLELCQSSVLFQLLFHESGVVIIQLRKYLNDILPFVRWWGDYFCTFYWEESIGTFLCTTSSKI